MERASVTIISRHFKELILGSYVVLECIQTILELIKFMGGAHQIEIKGDRPRTSKKIERRKMVNFDV